MTMRHSSKKKRLVPKNEPPVRYFAVVSAEDGGAATGTDNPTLQQRLINQVHDTLWLPKDLGDEERMVRIQSAISMLQGIKPADEIEGMLAAQMVSTHNAALECLRRAMIPGQTFDGQDQSMKHATKLLSIYSRQIEVLDKHRGKGQQTVTVEHVNVQSGGQAMVGHIETGSKDRSPRNHGNPKPTASPKTRRR